MYLFWLVLSFLVACSKKCIDYSHNNLSFQDLLSKSRLSSQRTFINDSELFWNNESQCHSAVFKVHSHAFNPRTVRPVDVLSGAPRIIHKRTQDQQKDGNNDFSQGYYPPLPVQDLIIKKLENKESGALINDIRNNIPLLIHVSFQHPFCTNRYSQTNSRIMIDGWLIDRIVRFSLIEPNRIQSRIAFLSQSLGIQLSSSGKDSVSLACNVETSYVINQ